MLSLPLTLLCSLCPSFSFVLVLLGAAVASYLRGWGFESSLRSPCMISACPAHVKRRLPPAASWSLKIPRYVLGHDLKEVMMAFSAFPNRLLLPDQDNHPEEGWTAGCMWPHAVVHPPAALVRAAILPSPTGTEGIVAATDLATGLRFSEKLP